MDSSIHLFSALTLHTVQPASPRSAILPPAAVQALFPSAFKPNGPLYLPRDLLASPGAIEPGGSSVQVWVAVKWVSVTTLK